MDDKFITKEIPPTGDYPRNTSDYPRSRDSAAKQIEESAGMESASKKPPNKFVRFLKFVFVRNIGLKVLAVVTAVVLWALIVGLGQVI